MSCEKYLTSDILYDCDNAAVGSLETSVVIINRNDINFSSIVYDAENRMVMTNFELYSGKTGILLEGVKQVNSSSFELVKKENGSDKKKHIFSGVILTLSAENKLQLENMSAGEQYVVIVNKKWKGANDKDAFDVLGIDVGLELASATYNSNENDGNAQFELSSAENYEEPKFPVNLLLTDYSTTKVAFDNKFIQS